MACGFLYTGVYFYKSTYENKSNLDTRYDYNYIPYRKTILVINNPVLVPNDSNI